MKKSFEKCNQTGVRNINNCYVSIIFTVTIIIFLLLFCLTRFLQSEVKIIHIIVQNNTYYYSVFINIKNPFSLMKNIPDMFHHNFNSRNAWISTKKLISQIHFKSNILRWNRKRFPRELDLYVWKVAILQYHISGIILVIFCVGNTKCSFYGIRNMMWPPAWAY